MNDAALATPWERRLSTDTEDEISEDRTTPGSRLMVHLPARTHPSEPGTWENDSSEGVACRSAE